MSDTHVDDTKFVHPERPTTTASMTPEVQMKLKSISIFSKQGILITLTVERPEFYINHVCVKFGYVGDIDNRMVTVSDYTSQMSNIVNTIGNLTYVLVVK